MTTIESASALSDAGNHLERLRRQRRLQVANPLIRTVYKGISGFQVSSDYRKASLLSTGEDKSLTYGEVVSESFLQILLYIERSVDRQIRSMNGVNDKPLKCTRFVDLGCGTGRACITAALSIGSMFQYVRGIELVPELAQLGIEAHRRLDESITQLQSSRFSRPQMHQKLAPNKLNKSPSSINPLELHKLSTDMLQRATNVLQAAATIDSGPSMAVDSLANTLCRDMGHKNFKASTKHYKTFIKFLQAHPTLFSLSGDGSQQTVTLLAVADQHATAVDQEINNDDDAADSSDTSYIHKIPAIIETKEDLEALLPLPSISIEVGNIFEVDWWTEGPTVAYAASLLFTEDMMMQLADRVRRMQPNSWFISLKLLPDLLESDGSDGDRRTVVLEDESFYKMSWQMAKVYIYRIV